MDLQKSGELLNLLRKRNKMTQKELAEVLKISPKTVSKWETGHGFPDVTLISDLAKILKVSTETLLCGNMKRNVTQAGNLNRIKFYVCPECNSITIEVGDSEVICCGQILSPLAAKETDFEHSLTITDVESDSYITFNHEMKKEHYISFLASVTTDRFTTVRLYPEQDPSVRLNRIIRGKIYFYCTNHKLYCHTVKRDIKKLP